MNFNPAPPVKLNRSIGWNLDRQGMNITQVIHDGADCYPWTECYAWLPVKTITGQIIWREKVFKRRIWVVWGTGFHMEPHKEYATLFEILHDIGDDRLLGKITK